YHWDFGDGGQSDAPNPIHMYATTGTYRVSVTVTDAQGQSVTRTFEFVVAPHSIPPSGGDGSLTPFVLAAAIAVAAVFAALWWNERRTGRIPPDAPRPCDRDLTRASRSDRPGRRGRCCGPCS